VYVPNTTDHFLENAKRMKTQMENKTTVLSKIRHRTTHSKEAVWASLSLTFIVAVLVVALLQSRIWYHRPFITSMESQPVKFEQYNRKAEIRVKDLLRSRGRMLLNLFPRKSSKVPQSGLRMDSFLPGSRDSVDCSRAFLGSSSSEDWAQMEEEEEDWEEEEEEVLFRVHRRTGNWQGEEKVSLLGRGRRRTHSSSSESSRGLLDYSVSGDLLRLSSETDTETEELMVKVG